MFAPKNGLFIPPNEGANGFGEEDGGYVNGDEGDEFGGEEEQIDDDEGGFWLEDEDGVHRMVQSVAFDTSAEMVWVGYNDGRLTSFLKTDDEEDDKKEGEDDRSPFVQYSAVNTQIGPIRAIDTDAYGVCSLSSNSFLYSTRGGIQNISKNGQKPFTCMASVKHNGDNITTGSTIESVYLAGRGVLQNFDLSVDKMIDIPVVEVPVTCMKMSRTLMCGTSDGEVILYDPRSDAIVSSFKAHMSGVAAMEVRGDQMACFGFPNPMDPFIKVFDIRMNKLLHSVMPESEPFAIRFHPVLANTLIVADKSGVLSLADVCNPDGLIPQMRIGCGGYMSSFSMSATGDAYLVGDMEGHAHVHVNRDDYRFNMFSEDIRLPEKTQQSVTLSLNEDDTEPLSSVPYPDFTDDLPEASNWNETQFPYYPVKKLDPMLLSFVRPCQVGSFLNIADLSGSQMKALVSSFPHLAYRIDIFREKMLASVPDKMYRYAVARTYKARPFDFQKCNRTAFAGLQNNMPNSYINSMLQMIYFMPQLRGAIRGHLCTRDYCLTCELAFLFHMLDGAHPMEGCTFTARNFVRAFRQIPQAHALSIVEQAGTTSHAELPTLLVHFAAFLFAQMEIEMTSLRQVSHSLGARRVFLNSPNPAVSKLFTMKKHTSLRCPNCASNWDNDSNSMFLDIIVPKVVDSINDGVSGDSNIKLTDLITSSSLRGGSIDFATILERSLHRVFYSKTWCEHCQHLQQVEQHRDIRRLPQCLLMTVESLKENDHWPGPNAVNVVTNNGIVSSPWLPLSVEIEVDLATGEPHVIGAVGKASDGSSEKKTVIYDLTTVISHVLDQSPLAPSSGNLVAHIRVSAEMAKSHGLSVSGVDGGWYLFNDFQVTQTSAAEAVRFPSWKHPCFMVYTRRETSVEVPEKSDLLLDCSLFLNPLLLNHNPTPIVFHDESELPKRGELVAIDSEFVSLSATGVVSELNGSHTTMTPSHLSVARVSCVFGEGKNVGCPLIDDHIFTPEPVVDYLTRFSGVTPRDLDPLTTNKRLVPFKDVYLKLRYLVDRGCILVGHGLANDFGVIGIHVPRDQYIDTVELFHKPRNRWISLRFLTSLFVGENIQEDVHCSLEDAKSSLAVYEVYKQLEKRGIVLKVIDEIYSIGMQCSWTVPVPPELRSQLSYPTKDDPLTLSFAFP